LNKSNSPEKAARILIFRIGELGDTLIALPALRAIKAAYPQAHLALLGNADDRGRHVRPQQLLPEGLIDQWISYPSAGQGGFSERLHLLARLRRGRYDMLVYLAPRIRSASDVRRDLVFFRLAGIKDVIGQDGFSALPRSVGASLPRVEQEADHLLSRLSLDGIPVPAPGDATFDLNFTESEEQAVERWWQEKVPVFTGNRAVGFGPGSKWPSKVWPEDRFLEVGRRLIKSRNVFPIVFGGPEDRELGNRLLSAWGQGANAAGELSVRHAAAALRRCVMYVGNDTGTMHLAASVGTRCVAIMSALDWPGHWNPYGPGHTVLRRSVPCEGCLLKVCEREAMRCLTEISVEDVVTACEDMLGAERQGHSAESEVQSGKGEVQSGKGKGQQVNCSLLPVGS
jgi:ADP-heptose:LPS heptosyltransferase